MAIEILGVRYLGIAEVADVLGLAPGTVAGYARRGQLKARRIGRRFYATEEAVAELVHAGTYPNTRPKSKAGRPRKAVAA